MRQVRVDHSWNVGELDPEGCKPRLIKAKPGDHFSWTDLQQSLSHPDRRMTLCAGVASDVRYRPEADIAECTAYLLSRV